MERRAFLTTICLTAGTGCLRFQGGGDEPTASPPDESISTPQQATTQTQGSTSETSPQETATRSETETASGAEQSTSSPSVGPIDGDFPEFGFNPENTGYVPDITGPQERLKVNWRGPRTGRSCPVIDGSSIYVGGHDGNLYALQDGETTWKASLGNSDPVSSGPVVTDSRVIIGGGDSRVHAFSKDGSTDWQSAQFLGDPENLGIHSTPTVQSSMVFFAGSDGHMHAIDAETGGLIWSRKHVGYGQRPAASDELVVSAAGTGDQDSIGVRAFSISDGEVQWTFGAGEDFSENAPVIKDDRVFVVNQSGQLYALDIAAGSEVWSHSFETKIKGQGPAVREGRLFLGDWEGNLYGVDADSGTIVWEYTFSEKIWASPVVTDHAVYAADMSGIVRALNPDDGSPIIAANTNTGPIYGIAITDRSIVLPSDDPEFGLTVVSEI